MMACFASEVLGESKSHCRYSWQGRNRGNTCCVVPASLCSLVSPDAIYPLRPFERENARNVVRVVRIARRCSCVHEGTLKQYSCDKSYP
ncbi:unnamed protein product [Ixodes hexagonus]